MQKILIKMQDIAVRYGPKTVISPLSLNISEGEFVTLVGPTGCGKSTLLRMVFGSQFPSQGIVTVSGREVTEIGRDRGIVFQKYSLMPNCTVVNNIALGLEFDRLSLAQRILHTPKYWQVRREARETAREMLAKIGLRPEDGNKLPHELSGGMRQRVAIAQALVLRPKVLLMDEPFGALDAGVRKGMQDMILDEAQRLGTTIIFVTHDLEEALFLGNRLLGLSQLWQHEDGRPGDGAILIYDKLIPGGRRKPHEFKYTEEFGQLLGRVQHDVLEPQDKLKPSQFVHDHPDAVKHRGVAVERQNESKST